MSLLAEIERLASAGQQAEMMSALDRAWVAGDGETLFAVANWHLFGVNGPRRLVEAHRLLEQAERCGHIQAAALRAVLVGNGTGAPADPERAAGMLARIAPVDAYAAVQVAFAPRMRDEFEAARLPTETLATVPSIQAVRRFLSPEECRYIVALASPSLQPSFVIDPRTGRRIPHPVRTSSGMSFGPTQEDLVINKINRRIARLTATQVSWGEPLHVLSYAPGQEYRPHLDAIPGEANQRHWTVLIYLNDDYGGGSTRFDLARVDFSGREGDALVFRNVDDRGQADPASRHAGLPVTRGTKWLATRWIRQADYHPWAA